MKPAAGAAFSSVRRFMENLRTDVAARAKMLCGLS